MSSECVNSAVTLNATAESVLPTMEAYHHAAFEQLHHDLFKKIHPGHRRGRKGKATELPECDGGQACLWVKAQIEKSATASDRTIFSDNKERSYISASVRHDRSFGVRFESAMKASALHYLRKGHFYWITEQVVQNNEGFQEFFGEQPPVDAGLAYGHEDVNSVSPSSVEAADHPPMESVPYPPSFAPRDAGHVGGPMPSAPPPTPKVERPDPLDFSDLANLSRVNNANGAICWDTSHSSYGPEGTGNFVQLDLTAGDLGGYCSVF